MNKFAVWIAAVGEEDFFAFGMTADEVYQTKARGYHPGAHYDSNQRLREVIDSPYNGDFSRSDRELFKPLLDSLRYDDPYMLLADYQSHVDCQDRVQAAFRDPDAWARMSILNAARMGHFCQAFSDSLTTTSSPHQIITPDRNFYTGSMERTEYIAQRNGGFYVVGTRVSLDSIVYSFKAGDSPETIRQNFSSLTLEQVYGAIAFYLAHEQEVDANIREGEAQIEHSVPPLVESKPELHARLERARHELITQGLAKH